MELRQLKYFIKAKALLNFTEAANQLNISQSTLSQQIQQLEKELGVPLFNRFGKRVTLTEAGENFSEFALQSISKADQGVTVIKDLNSLQTGTIAIGVTHGLKNLLTESLINFATAYPAIHINVTFGTSKELLKKLHQFEFDFVLTFTDSMDNSDLKYKSLFKSKMTFVTSKQTGIAAKEIVTLKEIAQLPLAIPSTGYSTIEFMNRRFKENSLQPNVCIEVNDIQTILELVKTGKWHTMLSETSVNDNDLIGIPIKGKDMIRSAMAVSLKDVYEKKAVKKFHEYLIPK